jgi:hypothetical protein
MAPDSIVRLAKTDSKPPASAIIAIIETPVGRPGFRGDVAIQFGSEVC